MARKNSDLFFGMRETMTEEQLQYESAIMNEDSLLVICNAKAGTGKTTIAVACAKLLVYSGEYDGLTYIFAPVEEKTLGYTTGDAFEKESKYHQPLKDALLEINESPEKAIFNPTSNQNTKKTQQSNAWVYACSHTFLRGTNIKNKVVIIDEAQNFTKQELRKVLTRIHDTCKVILIGSTVQSDIQNSGFQDYINYARSFKKATICNLTKSFRGELAEWADNIN